MGGVGGGVREEAQQLKCRGRRATLLLRHIIRPHNPPRIIISPALSRTPSPLFTWNILLEQS